MHQDAGRVRTLALLLAIIFLGAQFHFCADLTTGPAASSHFCPVCSAASSAVVAHSFSIAPLPIANRLETRCFRLGILTHIPLAISPRAPPSCSSIS
jgi:hypothetical protein